MKTSNFKKVLTLITLFFMLGQTLTPTVQVLADNLPTIQQSSEKKIPLNKKKQQLKKHPIQKK